MSGATITAGSGMLFGYILFRLGSAAPLWLWRAWRLLAGFAWGAFGGFRPLILEQAIRRHRREFQRFILGPMSAKSRA